ncbi:serine hydrolase domain-containing protein [Robiginitalea sp. IMCC44478]|uniref:serine hydrolase domain-containing protein n=1 Tax=Robiginitalea sp. IMCC44478 TaxID=3459122 RepID=UPI0040423C30
MKSNSRLLYSILIAYILCIFQLNAQSNTGIDASQMSKLIAFADSTYADEIMIIHKDKVVTHWKSKRCEFQYMGTASMSKSWTGLVIGIMIDRGLIRNENDLVCEYLPEWENGCKNRVTIKHLLNMTAGFNRRGPKGILGSADANHYAINAVLDTVPNIKFGYSNVSVQLLGILMEKVTGKNNNEYFNEVLFEPLGMDSTWLGKDQSKKNYIVYGGATTTMEDASKIGLLMKNGGLANGKRIISESWIHKSVTGSEHAAYYGYLWWIDTVSEYKNYAATGDLGHLTIIYPDIDLIFLRQQNCDTTKFKKLEYMGPQFLKLIASVVNQE